MGRYDAGPSAAVACRWCGRTTTEPFQFRMPVGIPESLPGLSRLCPVCRALHPRARTIAWLRPVTLMAAIWAILMARADPTDGRRVTAALVVWIAWVVWATPLYRWVHARLIERVARRRLRALLAWTSTVLVLGVTRWLIGHMPLAEVAAGVAVLVGGWVAIERVDGALRPCESDAERRRPPESDRVVAAIQRAARSGDDARCRALATEARTRWPEEPVFVDTDRADDESPAQFAARILPVIPHLPPGARADVQAGVARAMLLEDGPERGRVLALADEARARTPWSTTVIEMAALAAWRRNDLTEANALVQEHRMLTDGVARTLRPPQATMHRHEACRFSLEAFLAVQTGEMERARALVQQAESRGHVCTDLARHLPVTSAS